MNHSSFMNWYQNKLQVSDLGWCMAPVLRGSRCLKRWWFQWNLWGFESHIERIGLWHVSHASFHSSLPILWLWYDKQKIPTRFSKNNNDSINWENFNGTITPFYVVWPSNEKLLPHQVIHYHPWGETISELDFFSFFTLSLKVVSPHGMSVGHQIRW